MKQSCEKGFLKAGDMENINRYATKVLTADEVFVFTATLCDNDIDRDFEKFSLSSLHRLAELFLGKTVIADHSMKATDQRARIFDTYVERQAGTTADGEALYALKARAYMLKNEHNLPLIAEIEAGIKKEGSVSCLMGRHLCSVCGRDKSKEHCPHVASKTYDGKLCYTVLEEALDAYEFSFVAVPAQKHAGITKSFDKTKEYEMENVRKQLQECSDKGLTLSRAQAQALNDCLQTLEEEAALGETYKKELAKSVTALLKAKLPELEPALIQSVVAVMTAQELMGFKKGLTPRDAAVPQLQTGKPSTKQDKDYSQFKI